MGWDGMETLLSEVELCIWCAVRIPDLVSSMRRTSNGRKELCGFDDIQLDSCLEYGAKLLWRSKEV